MKTSPVKFDDLAFILLFFFMIVAVLSFSQKESVQVSTQEQSTKEQTISVYLDENGNLSQTVFNEDDLIDLHCSPNAEWQKIQKAIKSISEQKASVTLVIE